MKGKTRSTSRININVDDGLREEVARCSRLAGESVSAFFRESARQRVARMIREEQESLLKEAYCTLAEENQLLAEEHDAVDVEGWE